MSFSVTAKRAGHAKIELKHKDTVERRRVILHDSSPCSCFTDWVAWFQCYTGSVVWIFRHRVEGMMLGSQNDAGAEADTAELIFTLRAGERNGTFLDLSAHKSGLVDSSPSSAGSRLFISLLKLCIRPAVCEVEDTESCWWVLCSSVDASHCPPAAQPTFGQRTVCFLKAALMETRPN